MTAPAEVVMARAELLPRYRARGLHGPELVHAVREAEANQRRGVRAVTCPVHGPGWGRCLACLDQAAQATAAINGRKTNGVD